MTHQALSAGQKFPDITVTQDGETVPFGKPRGEYDWRLAIVYRGRHCPLCTKYLKTLDTLIEQLLAIGVGVDVVSGDSEEQLEEHKSRLGVSYPIAHGLTVDQMKTLGLYVSDPRSEKETDHPFAEPGLFVVNAEGNIQILDISNAPFSRPDLETLISGIKFIRENDYPVRGTHGS